MKYFKMLCLLLISAVAFGQAPTLEDLPREIRKEYRKDVKETEKVAKRALKDGFDIVPDPIETPIVIPSEYMDDPAVQGIISWQTSLQRMPELEKRIKTECTYPVHFKVSDSGVDQNHRDLQAGFVAEYDWTGEGHNPGNHGTHVAGDIIQFMYPLIETGVATYDDQKSLRAAGTGSFAWAANMFFNNIEDVEERTAAGQTVIWNCSWGGGTSIIESLETQMRKNVEAGAIIVAAAGNSGGAVGYPGKSEQVFGITSLDESMTLSYFSSRGPEVDGTAGGRNIYSALPGNQYGLMSGTSMASPSFAAIFVGYARAKWGPDLLPDYDALRQYYKQIAVQVGDGNPELYGFGYPYIEAILNTRPGGTPPDDPDDPEPPTDPSLYYAQGEAVQGFMIPWKYETDNEFRYLYVPSIEFEVVGEGGEQEAYEQAYTFIEDFFKNRAIVLLPDMDWYSATKWTGRFINLVAANADIALEVKKITGKQSGSGMIYTATDFSWNQQAFAESLLGVYLIDVE